MSDESHTPVEPPDPDEDREPPEADSGSPDVFRSADLEVAPPDLTWGPGRAVTDESGDAVQGEHRMPEAFRTWDRSLTTPAETFDFDDLYLTHSARLIVAVRRYCAGDHALAEEIVQETFLKAYQLREQLAHHPAPHAWLRTVAFRAATDNFRREGRRATQERERELLRPPDGDEVDTRLWLLVIRQLPEPQRQVMWCRFILRHERQTIADALGMSLRSVDYHIKKALEQLRRSLDPGEEG